MQRFGFYMYFGFYFAKICNTFNLNISFSNTAMLILCFNTSGKIHKSLIAHVGNCSFCDCTYGIKSDQAAGMQAPPLLRIIILHHSLLTPIIVHKSLLKSLWQCSQYPPSHTLVQGTCCLSCSFNDKCWQTDNLYPISFHLINTMGRLLQYCGYISIDAFRGGQES